MREGRGKERGERNFLLLSLVPPILVVRIPQTPLVASQFDDQIRTLWREFTNKMSVFTSKKILRPKSKNFVVGNTGNQLAFSELESAS